MFGTRLRLKMHIDPYDSFFYCLSDDSDDISPGSGIVPLIPATYEKYLQGGGEIMTDATERPVSHEGFKRILMERAREKAYNSECSSSCNHCGSGCDSDINTAYRSGDGRFRNGNTFARSIHLSDDEFRLLYMVYGSRGKIAEALGISRQTVWRKTKDIKDTAEWQGKNSNNVY